MAQLHDELLAQMPEGARHDADVCSFCTDKARQNPDPAPVPSGQLPSGASVTDPLPEGGTTHMADNANETLSRETHEALLAKAVSDATSATDDALATKTEEVASLTAEVEKLKTDNATLTADNDRLNKELDTAQVSLKAATDEVASLKADVEAAADAARKAEIASKRSEQVKNLGLFSEEYVQEKASKWAEISDDDWAERVEEWSKAKPASATEPTSDSASAMSGTTEKLGQDEAGAKPTNARRAALGLI